MTAIELCPGIAAFAAFWLLGIFAKRLFYIVASCAILTATLLLDAWIDGTTVRFHLFGTVCVVVGGITALCACPSKLHTFRPGSLLKSAAGLAIVGLLFMIAA